MQRAGKDRKCPGIRRDYEVPFASGLLSLHPDHAPKADDGLIAVTSAQWDEDRRLLREGYWFRYTEADRVCNFIEKYCRHYQGRWAGQLLKLEQWQRRFVRRLFGWYRPDGTRRYREAFLFVPRGNGKTLLAAALELYLTGADGENAPVVISSATTEDQALLCYTAAREMIDGSEELAANFDVFTTEMYCRRNNGVLKVITGNPGDGDNPHGAVVDEYHQAKTDRVYAAIKTGMGKREQPLLIIITTAGVSIGGPCHKAYEHAQKIMYGVIPWPATLAVIYEPPDDCDWRDASTWSMANPNIGVSLKESEIAEDSLKAQLDPTYQGHFLTKRLNIWTNAVRTWMDMGKWKSCGAKLAPDLSLYAGREAFGGIDLAQTQDLCAFVLLFPWDDATREKLPPAVLRRTKGVGFDIWARFYLPEDGIDDKARRDGVAYRQWAKDKHLVLTPGDATDYDFIKADVLRAAEVLQLRDVGYDKQFAETFASDLFNNHGVPMTRITQSFDELTPPIQRMEQLVLARGLRHGNNPVLSWTFSNCVMKVGARGGKMPDKRPDKGSRGRIDGVPAALMALHRAMVSSQQGTAGGVDWV